MVKTNRVGRFAEADCDAVDFRFLVAKDKFNLDDFMKSMESKGFSGILPQGAVTCRTQFPDRTDYHIHFVWAIRRDMLDLRISYDSRAIPLEGTEPEPFAEQFMEWIGQFFAAESANAGSNGLIGYSNADRQSRYLLPIRVGIVPGLDTTINGVSIEFPARPQGIEFVRLVVHKERMTLAVNRTAKVVFRAFDVYEHLTICSDMARSLTESRK
jgi:hypothetical protein